MVPKSFLKGKETKLKQIYWNYLEDNSISVMTKFNMVDIKSNLRVTKGWLTHSTKNSLILPEDDAISCLYLAGGKSKQSIKLLKILYFHIPF